jgi:hypothetical protein
MSLTKSEILQDECKFQDACSIYVRDNVGYCVSSLMYDIEQNLEACSRIFDFDYDYDEAIGWFQRDDWAEPVVSHIRNADLDELEAIANIVGWWDDVLEESGVPEIESEDGTLWKFDGRHFDDEDDATHAARMSVISTIREKVIDLITDDDEYREIASECCLDPDTWEIYEHWIVDRYFANELRSQGHVVFDFCDLTIWGRPTTGQSISMDGVVRNIVRGLDDNHYIWGQVR